MIAGAHVLIFADDAEKARTFLRDKLGWDSVDAGDGWLVFALPPAELGVHPADEESPSGSHLLYLLCHDIQVAVEELASKGVELSEVQDRGFGLVTRMTIPGAGTIGLYQPKHASPLPEFPAP